MNEENKNQERRYRVEYRREDLRYKQTEVVTASSKEELDNKVAELMKPAPKPEVQEPPRADLPVITELYANVVAGLVAESVRERLDDLKRSTERSTAANFQFKDIQVNETIIKGRFCVRALVNYDTTLIEAELKKGFAKVEDVNCSAEGMIPELDKEFPDKDGYHEFVCIVEPHKAIIEDSDIIELVKVQQYVCYFSDFANAYYDTKGECIDDKESTDQELLALAASGNGYIETLALEMGGQEFLDHRDLCEDGYQAIGQPRYYKLVEVSKEEYDSYHTKRNNELDFKRAAESSNAALME